MWWNQQHEGACSRILIGNSRTSVNCWKGKRLRVPPFPSSLPTKFFLVPLGRRTQVNVFTNRGCVQQQMTCSEYTPLFSISVPSSTGIVMSRVPFLFIFLTPDLAFNAQTLTWLIDTIKNIYIPKDFENYLKRQDVRNWWWSYWMTYGDGDWSHLKSRHFLYQQETFVPEICYCNVSDS